MALLGRTAVLMRLNTCEVIMNKIKLVAGWYGDSHCPGNQIGVEEERVGR